MKFDFKALTEFIKIHRVKFIISALCLVAAGAIAVTVWAIWFREAPVLNPDYAAKETEKEAEKIEGSNPDGGEESELNGGKISVLYSTEITLDLSEGKAALLIGNLAKSKHNIVAEVVIQDNVIIQSGAIMPGYRVTNLEMLEGAEKILREGIYKGVIRLHLYDTQTNEKEMLSSEIEAEIRVVG